MIVDVIAFVGHDPPDDACEFDGGCGGGGEVMQSLASASQVVVAKFAFLPDGDVGYGPEGMSKEGRPAFADFPSGRVILSGLKDAGVQSDEGDELFGLGEGFDGIGLAEEADAPERIDAWECEQVAGQLLGDCVDLLFELFAYGVQRLQLRDQGSDGDTHAFESALHSDGPFGEFPDALGLFDVEFSP